MPPESATVVVSTYQVAWINDRPLCVPPQALSDRLEPLLVVLLSSAELIDELEHRRNGGVESCRCGWQAE